MKKLLLVLGMCALCPAAWSQDRPDRNPIDVSVVNGQIFVEEQVAVTRRNEGGLVWRVVTAGYQFPANGIVIESTGRHHCQVIANGRLFRCAKLRHDSGERYKYNVNLIVSQSGQSLAPLDPWIQND